MIFKLQKEELEELFLAIFILSFVFSIKNFTLDVDYFFRNFILLSIFVFSKEIMQKIYAKKIGYSSKFKIYPLSSILAIFVSFIGIRLAAPGYSELQPYKFSDWKFKRKKFSVEDEGKIVFVGYLVFLIFCILLVLLEIKDVKNMLAFILIFNLLPILPFDGTKILKWNFSIWGFLFIFSLILLIL